MDALQPHAAVVIRPVSRIIAGNQQPVGVVTAVIGAELLPAILMVLSPCVAKTPWDLESEASGHPLQFVGAALRSCYGSELTFDFRLWFWLPGGDRG